MTSTQVFVERCPCGNDKTSRQVRAECDWSVFGYLALAVLGVNPRPRSVAFRCTRCMTLLERTTDKAVCEAHRSPT